MEAALRKRTEYFREYQRMRRDIAAKNGMCVDCTTRIRARLDPLPGLSGAYSQLDARKARRDIVARATRAPLA